VFSGMRFPGLHGTPLFADPTLKMTTPIADKGKYRNSNVVKVVTDREWFAFYFSRSPLFFKAR
jgi:CMP-2-keto-3-deoxyoctulosonic acid synthetase